MDVDVGPSARASMAARLWARVELDIGDAMGAPGGGGGGGEGIRGKWRGKTGHELPLPLPGKPRGPRTHAHHSNHGETERPGAAD